MDNKLAFDVNEAAEMLSISRRTLYELIRAKRIGSIKIGSRRLVRLTDLTDFLDNCENDAA
jgi:excisionase family DNA binding protein